MASSLVTFESVSFACSHIMPIFSLLSNPFVVSTFSSPKTANYIKLKHFPKASSSSEGLPTELIEDSKFVPLTAEDPQFGPPANSGLEPAVFAALVPNSADKPLQELLEEIMGDHEMLSAKRSGQALPNAE
ncbi:hypothetical protein RHSIM_RhsimUnG0185100 [Rhododendron simsii]|uniref:Uncharacterized protein n=1 Tax=Rhododendron simsii TaxID=118357 RepID=A0A834FW11_RHOSS|nr:hypothetical protein RHSIM_RhsimUnG0185100 [Rhododendron simsii]